MQKGFLVALSVLCDTYMSKLGNRGLRRVFLFVSLYLGKVEKTAQIISVVCVLK